MTTAIIEKPLTRFRTTPAKGAKPRVDRTGGVYGAGLITGAAAITRGEALGHGAWVDSFAVDSVVELGNRSPKGVKVRFTHPGLSADGMGTQLGRMKNFRREGDRAVGDVHLSRTAHKTPDGDLAEYVMNMADEDAEAFGMSIVFEHDRGAENRFHAEHENEDGYFQSPDADNSSNYSHIRLAKLWASDVVDEPAANPAGLFRHGHEIADEADRLCEYALGLSAEQPTLQHLSVDAERLAQYAARFLNSHNLELKEKEMTTPATAPAGITTEQLNAQLTAFGTELLGKVNEQIAAALKPQAPPPLTEAELQAKGVERFTKFREVAATAGLKDPDKIAKSWFDKGLSLEQLQASIEPMLINQNPLTRDTGEQPGDPLAKYKAEYAAQRAAFAKMGTTEAEYCTSRQIDDGLLLLEPVGAAEAA
jgi:hypothetical protein